MLMVSTILDFFYLPYLPLAGTAYWALANSMACRVFRMVILCAVDARDLNTRDIERAMELGAFAQPDKYVRIGRGCCPM